VNLGRSYDELTKILRRFENRAPVALMAEALGFSMAANIDSHSPSITTVLLIFLRQIFCVELRFSAKSRQHFVFRYSDIEN